MPNPWPSPLPGEAWRCYRVAYDHLLDHTLAGLPEVVQGAILRDPEVQAGHDKVCDLAHAGDVEQVKIAAKQWQVLVRKAKARYAKEEKAA